MEAYKQTVSLKGKLYYTVKTFALLTRHTEQSIYFLISHGNSVRKLSAVYFCDKPLIPVTELTEFPFTSIGRKNKAGLKAIYHFDKEGNQV